MTNWKPIPGLEGYEASSEGHIRDNNSKLLKEKLINSGYLTVYCAKYGDKLVHRLVCAAFSPTENLSNQVNHINGITTDNRPENLAWISLGDNVRDFWTNPIFKEKQQRRKKQVGDCMRSRIWITDGSINYRVIPEELQKYPTFRRGRTSYRKETI